MNSAAGTSDDLAKLRNMSFHTLVASNMHDGSVEVQTYDRFACGIRGESSYTSGLTKVVNRLISWIL